MFIIVELLNDAVGMLFAIVNKHVLATYGILNMAVLCDGEQSEKTELRFWEEGSFLSWELRFYN